MHKYEYYMILTIFVRFKNYNVFSNIMFQSDFTSSCPVTEWSMWSPCNVTCGKGVSVKSRLLLVSGENYTKCIDKIILEETRSCNGSRPTCDINASLAKGEFMCVLILILINSILLIS